MNIVGIILTVVAIFIAIKIARRLLKVIFVIVALIGIAISLYGNQITTLILNKIGGM